MKNTVMLRKVMTVIGVLALFALTAQAVEDGLGTNVVRNLRVNDGGAMELGGTAITNWTSMPVGTGAVSLVDYVAWSNVVHDATNALNTSVTNVSYQVTNVLYAATNALNTSVTNVSYQVTNVLYAATNALNTSMTNVSYQVTNNLYNATNALQIQVDTKLDRSGGTATNLTVKEGLTVESGGVTITAGGLAVSGNITNNSAMINTPAANQTIMANSEAISVANLTFKTIESASGGPYSASITAGTAGQNLILQGAATATNTVTITNNPPDIVLAEGVDFTMNTNDVLQLICNAAGKWTEVNRVDN